MCMFVFIFFSDYPISVLVDGGWGEWSSPSACSTSCGLGELTRTRQCNNPTPQFGGEFCEGDDTETQTCQSAPCPGKKEFC